MEVPALIYFLSPVCFQLFSIVILGCVSNEGYVNRPEEVEEFCIFNRNQNVCNYAVAMGTLCFLCCSAFLALDVYFPQISGVKDRKKAVMADIGVSGKSPPLYVWCSHLLQVKMWCSPAFSSPVPSAAIWSLVWFLGFCFLANQWQVSKVEDNPLNEGADAARASIVFAFFSVFSWVSVLTHHHLTNRHPTGPE